MTPESYENFLNQLNDLIKLIDESRSKKAEISPEIEERIARLESVVKILSNANKETYLQLGLSEQKIDEAVEKSKELPLKERTLFQKSQILKAQIQKRHNEILHEVAIAKQRKKRTGKQGEKERQKKFRGLGGRKDWKPL